MTDNPWLCPPLADADRALCTRDATATDDRGRRLAKLPACRCGRRPRYVYMQGGKVASPGMCADEYARAGALLVAQGVRVFEVQPNIIAAPVDSVLDAPFAGLIDRGWWRP